eukprot:gb/GEZN01011265.1/.p1 GENE.gb/GEZN01011265.1/~~gb/GEZN01011265.1/.p1  ORF type:complete len:358 (+),score=27.46 gb/GEZN01011265.1/:64-1137(+)
MAVHIPVFPALSDSRATQWLPGAHDEFFAPELTTQGCQQVGLIKEQLHAVRDGVRFAVRGRDYGPLRRDDAGMPSRLFSKWEYGVAQKMGQRLHFLWRDGETEDFLIDGIDYIHLIHFRLSGPPIESKHSARSVMGTTAVSTDNFVVIAHGYSPQPGPNYPLIRTLERVARKAGWSVVVPDFRPTYEFQSQRSRAERSRILTEELLCITARYRPKQVVLVGHSQGGAAVAQVCTQRTVAAAQVKGVLMLGAESPAAFDKQLWRPHASHVLLVHAAGDRVIHPCSSESLAKHWGVPFVCLENVVAAGTCDAYGDDICHDFLSSELMSGVVSQFEDFLSQCSATSLGNSDSLSSIDILL